MIVLGQLRPCDPGYEQAVKAHCTGCRYYRTGISVHARVCAYSIDTGRLHGGSVFECERNDGKKKRATRTQEGQPA